MSSAADNTFNNAIEQSFVDCLIKQFIYYNPEASNALPVCDYVIPAHFNYNQEQRVKLNECAITPGISFPISYGFGNEDDTSEVRAVNPVSSIFTIHQENFQIKKQDEDEDKYEITFNYSSIAKVEIQVHFAATLFTSNHVIGVERSMFASEYILCPPGKKMIFASSDHHIYGDLNKHFPSLYSSSHHDRFDLIIIARKAINNDEGSHHQSNTVIENGNFDWFSCFPMTSLPVVTLSSPSSPSSLPPNSNHHYTKATSTVSPSIDPVTMEKEIYTCMLHTGAVQELQGLLQLRVPANTNIITRNENDRTINKNDKNDDDEDDEGKKITDQEHDSWKQMDEHDVMKSSEISPAIIVATTTITATATTNTNTTQTKYMDIASARQRYLLQTQQQQQPQQVAAAPALHGNKTQEIIHTKAITPVVINVEKMEAPLTIPSNNSSRSRPLEIMEIAIDITNHYYQLYANPLPTTATALMMRNNSSSRPILTNQRVYKELEIFGLLSSSASAAISSATTDNKQSSLQEAGQALNTLDCVEEDRNMMNEKEKGKGLQEKEEEKEQKENEDTVCVICLSNRKEIMYYPCRHTHICYECFQTSIRTLREEHNNNGNILGNHHHGHHSQCPICREAVTLALYFPA